jgi:hypothetical protein
MLAGAPLNLESLPMSETIIAARPEHRIWVPTGKFPHGFDLVDVVAWAIGPSGPPAPITVAGRLDKHAIYILGCEAGWIVLPEGRTFRDVNEANEWLSRRAA